MKYTFFFFLIPTLFSCANHLEEKEQTIELEYIAWGCDCANWAQPADIVTYQEAADTLAKRSVFIEPAVASLELPDTLGFSGDIIAFTGSFYQRKGFPKGYSSGEHPDRARVFRYTSFKILESRYKGYKDILSDTTLITGKGR